MHSSAAVDPAERRPPGPPAVVTVTNLDVSFLMPTPMRLRVRGIRRQLHAVRDVSLVVRRGTSLTVVGESGCGKSTLAKAIVGLLPPSAGSVTLDLESRDGGPPPVQMVFQDPTSSLDPRQRVGDAIAEVLRAHRLVPRAAVRARCQHMLELVGLPPRVLTALPRQLSGGQRQRVAIARALALEPAVLVADEAVASLDVSVKAGILNLLQELQRDLGLTLILITHDLSTVRHVSDELAVMYLGSIVEQGAADVVMNEPHHPYTRALLAAAPRLHADHIQQGVCLDGEPPSPLAPPTGCPFHPRCPLAQESCRRERPPLIHVSPGHKVACPIGVQRASPSTLRT